MPSYRPPSLKRPTALPRGPRWVQQLRKQAKLVSGPGEPPPGFATATTSNLEWIVYWALYKILIPTEDPRNSKGRGFYGYDGIFRYQKAFQGGRDPGGSLIDFVVEYGPKVKTMTAIRCQSVYRHQDAPAREQSVDRLKKIRIASQMPVIDLWDRDLLYDNGTSGSGEKAIVAVKQALGMIQIGERGSISSAIDVRYALGGRR